MDLIKNEHRAEIAIKMECGHLLLSSISGAQRMKSMDIFFENYNIQLHGYYRHGKWSKLLISAQNALNGWRLYFNQQQSTRVCFFSPRTTAVHQITSPKAASETGMSFSNLAFICDSKIQSIVSRSVFSLSCFSSFSVTCDASQSVTQSLVDYNLLAFGTVLERKHFTEITSRNKVCEAGIT